MLHALLTHPAIQAGLAPFLLALLTAELLQRMRLSGLAMIAGFALTVYLASSFAYTPLSATRKIIWMGLASGLIAIPLGLFNWSLWRPVLAVLAASAAIWVTLPLLLQHATPEAMQLGAGCALFTGWIIYWMDTLEDSPVRAASAGMALGLGTGATLLIAGAALTGKLNLAVGSAALGYLFIMFVSNSHLSCGRTFTLPLALITSLSAAHAVLSVKLPWYALAPLAAIPFIAKIPVSEKSPVWVHATLLSFATLVFATGAIYLSWRVNGWSAF
jgi:hypothetical protein